MLKYLFIATMTAVPSLSIFRAASRRPFVQAFIRPIQMHRAQAATMTAPTTFMHMSSTRSTSDSSNLPITRTEVRKMKVVELRQELEAQGLDTQGLRKDLLDRLLDALPATNKSGSSKSKSDEKREGTYDLGAPNEKRKKIKQQSTSTNKLHISSETLYVLRYHGQQHHTSATASCGFILYNSQTEKEIWSGSKFYSTGESAQRAEVKALLATLPALSDLGVQKLIIQGHAGGVTIQQLQGNYGVKSKSVKEIFAKIQEVMDEFEECEVWGIAMDQVAKAQTVSKKALSSRRSEGFDLLKLVQAEEDNEAEKIDGKTTSVDTNDDGGEHDMTEHVQVAEEIQSNAQHPIDEREPLSRMETEEEQHLVSLPSFSPDKTYVLRFDGGSRGNPGTSGAGMVLFDSDSGLEVWAAFQYLGDTTNNVAEYTALLSGIQFASAMGIARIVAEGDSTLVVKQVTGEYRVKSDHLKALNKSVKAVVDSFDYFSIHYIPRAENFRADQLANVAMDEQATMGLEVLDFLEEQQPEVHSEEQGTNQARDDGRLETSTPTYETSPESPQQQAVGGCVSIPEAEVSDRQLSPNRTYVLQFGGGMKGKAGMGSAAILMDDLSGEEIWSGTYFCQNEDVSQFIAGYTGLIIGLRKALSMGVTRLIVQGNMEFVIHQMSGKWKVKSEAIKPYQAHAKEVCENYFEDVDFEIIDERGISNVKALYGEATKCRQSRLSGFQGYT